MRIVAIVTAVLIALSTAACDPAGPQPVTSATTGPELPAGQARIFVMREHSIMQAGVPAEIGIDGARVTTLRHEEYTYLDVPPGKHLLSVAGLPNDGAWRMAVEIGPKQASYLLITPNKRPEDRQTMFPSSRKFDLQGGPFVVRTTDARTGEGLLRTMQFRRPSTQAIPPTQG